MKPPKWRFGIGFDDIEVVKSAKKKRKKRRLL